MDNNTNNISNSDNVPDKSRLLFQGAEGVNN